MRPSLLWLIPCLVVCGCTREARPNKTVHQAAAEGDVAELTIHLQQKHPIDAADERGQTPLLLAVEAGQVEAARLLLENGAAAQVALVPAVKGGQTKLVALLIDQGAEVNARTPDGTSAMGAALGNAAMESLLREYGARLGPEEVLRRLFKHLDVIAALMLEYKTDCPGAEQESRRYIDKHRAEITALVKAMKSLEASQDQAEREEIKRVTLQMTEALMKKIMTAFTEFAQNCPQQMAAIAKSFEAFSEK